VKAKTESSNFYIYVIPVAAMLLETKMMLFVPVALLYAGER
jgi:hypothetical protein